MEVQKASTQRISTRTWNTLLKSNKLEYPST